MTYPVAPSGFNSCWNPRLFHLCRPVCVHIVDLVGEMDMGEAERYWENTEGRG